MIILNYKSKKQLKENIGNSLDYSETSLFGPEYMANGTFPGSNRMMRRNTVSGKRKIGSPYSVTVEVKS